VDAPNRPVPELGELERGILRYLWRVGDADVLQVHAAVGARRGISVNTVGSGLERLYRKRLVSRWKVSHAYRYKPTLDRDHFAVRQLADSVRAAGAREPWSSRVFSRSRERRRRVGTR